MKNLLLSFLALSLPLSAAAETTVYGKITGGINTTRTTFGDGRSTTRSNIGDYGSHIGMRGSIPLGGQTRSTWQIEKDVPVIGTGSMHERFRQRRENARSPGFDRWPND